MKPQRAMQLLVLVLAVAPAARAQSHAAGCDRIGTTSIRFGLAGGDLMPSSTELTAAGVVRRRSNEGAGATMGHVPRDSVRALARRAWRGGFAALPPAPTRPTRNPDAARQVIELYSACGWHHVEYGPGQESALFRELYARLTRLTAAMTHRRNNE